MNDKRTVKRYVFRLDLGWRSYPSFNRPETRRPRTIAAGVLAIPAECMLVISHFLSFHPGGTREELCLLRSSEGASVHAFQDTQPVTTEAHRYEAVRGDCISS